MLPFFIGLVAIPESASPWIRYALLTGVNGIPYTHSILVGMTSSNAKGVGTRAVSTAVYNMCYQIGSIVAVNVYRDEDKPYCINPIPFTPGSLMTYPTLHALRRVCVLLCFFFFFFFPFVLTALADYTGNKALTGLCAANIVLFGFTKVYYIWRNKVRQRQYDQLSWEEKCNQADFRFVH